MYYLPVDRVVLFVYTFIQLIEGKCWKDQNESLGNDFKWEWEQVCILCFVQGYDVWSENVVNIKVGPLIRRREDRKLRGVVTITADICGHPHQHQPGFISIIKFGMNTFTGTLDILSTPPVAGCRCVPSSIASRWSPHRPPPPSRT